MGVPSWLPLCAALHWRQSRTCHSPAAPAGCCPSCTQCHPLPAPPCACLLPPPLSRAAACLIHCACPQYSVQSLAHTPYPHMEQSCGNHCLAALLKVLRSAGNRSSPLGGGLRVDSGVSQAAIPVGAPSEELARARHSNRVMLARRHCSHCAPPRQGYKARKHHCTLPTVDVELWMPCHTRPAIPPVALGCSQDQCRFVYPLRHGNLSCWVRMYIPTVHVPQSEQAYPSDRPGQSPKCTKSRPWQLPRCGTWQRPAQRWASSHAGCPAGWA